MDQWLREHLVCPRDKRKLELNEQTLTCPDGHKYPVIDGIPVMLLEEVEQTLWVAKASLEADSSSSQAASDIPYADTLGIDPEEREQLKNFTDSGVDPVVQMSIAKTCGNLYAPLVGNLKTYPIPELRLPQGNGELFLDIGCNWGRWCVAAGRKGYDVVGIDPSLGAVMAARRVCKQLGIKARFVVADGRFLPFAPAIFDIVFSYSVLQHISKDDVRLALNEVARVLKESGTSLIQLPNIYGIRCLYNNARRGFSEGKDFDVRYWSLSEMRKTFTSIIGQTSFSVDGYFGLGIQKSDLDILPPTYRLIVRCSEALRRMSQRATWMTHFADSVYVKSSRALAAQNAGASSKK